MAGKKSAAANDQQVYLQVVASCNEACAAMDFSDDGWKPPVGQYDVRVVEAVIGGKVKDGVQTAWLKPIFEIISEGEFTGRTFSEFIYITPNAKELTPGLKQLLRLATCLAGREIRNASEAFQIIQDSVGEFLTVEFRQNVGKGKNAGKVFLNLYFLNKIESTEVAEA